MSFVLFLSIMAMTTAVVGCAVIWGFDVARAREVERDTIEQSRERLQLQQSARRAELHQRPTA